MTMKIAPRVAAQAKPISEKKYDFKGAVVRALTASLVLDTDAIPKKGLAAIGDWTDTTWQFTKAFIGKDTVYVHADDMLAPKNLDEGFIAATADGKVVASGGFKVDAKNNFVPSSIRFDRKPTGIGQ